MGSAVLALWLAGYLQVTFGGTVQHDPGKPGEALPDYTAYEKLAAMPAYAAVGKVQQNRHKDIFASGTLINPRWVLITGHAAWRCNQDAVFYLDGSAYAIDAAVIPDEWRTDAADRSLPSQWKWVAGHDIALLRLKDTVTAIKPARCIGSSDPPLRLGSVVTMVGFGRRGTGLCGEQRNTSGKKTAGNNSFDAWGSYFSWADGVLLADFDRPGDPTNSIPGGSADPLPLEYQSALKDSGGGLFARIDGIDYLVGVLAGSESRLGAPDIANGYHWITASTSVRPYEKWLSAKMAGVYELAWNDPDGGDFADRRCWRCANDPGFCVLGGPGRHDTAIFDKPGKYTVNLTGSVTNKRLAIRNGDVMLVGDYQYTATEAIEIDAPGVLTVSDKGRLTTKVAGRGNVTTKAAGKGNVITKAMRIGNPDSGDGHARVIQAGGVVRIAGTLSIGLNAKAKCTHELAGGSLQVDTIDIGKGGKGELNWTGGQITSFSGKPTVTINLYHPNATFRIAEGLNADARAAPRRNVAPSRGETHIVA